MYYVKVYYRIKNKPKHDCYKCGTLEAARAKAKLFLNNQTFVEVCTGNHKVIAEYSK